MTSFRQRLREVADQYQGLAALGGAFVAGVAVAASAMGFLTLPGENRQAIGELRKEVTAADSALYEEMRDNDQSLQRAAERNVEQLTVMTTFLCVLAARFDAELAGSCPALRLRGGGPDG